MTTKALIFVNSAAKDDAAFPRSFLKAGGISLLERQLRQLKRLGIEKAVLVTGEFLGLLDTMKFRMAPEHIEIVYQPDMKPEGHFDAKDKVLVVEEGVVIDERIYKAVLAKKARRSVAIFPEKTVIYGKGYGLKFKDGSKELLFASAATVEGQDVIKAFNVRGFQKAPMKTLLKVAIETGKAPFVDIAKLPIYLPDRRREVDIMWRPVANKDETGKATRAIIATAQKGCLDWPARWIHPIFENAVVELICPYPVSPNMITVVTGIVGFWITWLFATGEMELGLLMALVIGVLDGVDGKLARTKMMQTNIGELEHILDKLVEYSWYFGIAWFLAGAEGNALPWALAVMIVLFAWAEVVQGEFFRRLTGKQLDDAGDFERTFRIIGARRNTQMWGLIPFALFNAWLLGFWFIALYAAATFFVAQARFIIRVRDFGSEKSLDIKRNFDDTAYF